MTTVGIDEVGRGCWAGPLVAGAVILRAPIAGLDDSKKLTSAKRERLNAVIEATAQAIGIGWVWPQELDTIGLTAAVSLAMHRAMAQIANTFDAMIIDGNSNYFLEDSRAKAIVKADGSVPCVSAASIVAKVARDRYMTEVEHRNYPQYAFDKHVGYGTSLHQQMLRRYGICASHRTSFRPIQALQLSQAGAA